MGARRVKAADRFLNQPKFFWAHVRAVSQRVGYTVRGQGRIRIPGVDEIADALATIGLRSDHVRNVAGKPTAFGDVLADYFVHRAAVLNDFVEPRLMDAVEAKDSFEQLLAQLSPKCPLPLNKQKGEKRAYAYLTGIVNMLVEANIKGFSCDYDPRQLTTVTRDDIPLRTLARRIDGAFPSSVNPVAIWEIKEYYYTTTFGSRVADGVYETLVDGIELEELREHEEINIRHYLMLDSHYTWWVCGRSYLCRVIDMLHMGLVDEVLFGREVIERLPALVSEWVELARRRPN